MKRIIQFLLVMLVIVKITLGGFFFFKWHPWSVSTKGEAVASESAPAPAAQQASQEKPNQEPPALEVSRMQAQREDLKRREQAIAAQKADLEKLQASLDERIKTLRRLRNEIRAEQEKKQQIQTAKLKHLIKAYSAMKPQSAASLIENMDTQFAVQVFSKMKGAAVGQILSHVAVKKATEISENLLKKK